MNITTIPSNVIMNTTSSTMQTIQESPGGEDHQDNSVGAYTAVLAITAHVVAMIFGGGKSLAVITAVLTKRNVDKYSYLLVLTLLFACCCVNFVYGPVEISDLLTYHYHHRHPCPDFLAAKTASYGCLVALISIVIVLITHEAIFRQGSCFGHILRKIWPLTACLFALAWSAILTIVLISKLVNSTSSLASPSSSTSSQQSSSSSVFTTDSDSIHHPSYVITDDPSQITFLVIAILITSLVLLSLIVLLVQSLKSSLYWEGGFPRLRKKKTSLAMPEFLISQSQNDCEDEEYTGGYDNVNEPSTSRSPSPSTPKLLMVSSPDSASIKGGGGEGIPLAQQQTTPKSSGNRLGINMAHYLGRRRHTICQISDSSTPAPPPDPISKAKQYNYVRKFSVDISALQAQLQNPKIFKEQPFQSDMDISKRTGGGGGEDDKTKKPLQPLQPLNFKLNDEKKCPADNKETPPGATEVKVETPQSAGLSIPPPVIMVSNDDVIPEKDDTNTNDDIDDDNEKENEGSGTKITENAITTPSITTTTEDNNKNNSNHETTNKNDSNTNPNPNTNTPSRPVIPTSLSLKGEPNTQIIINTAAAAANNNATNDVIVTSPIPPPTIESGSSPAATASPHHPKLQGASSSTRDDNGYQLARLSVGLCATFVITMLPVVIVHAMRKSGSEGAFVSVSTCTLAISTALQTIVYPHLIACFDGVVRRAVRRMKDKVKRFCLVYLCRRGDDYDDDEDDDDDDDDRYNGVARGGHRPPHGDDTSSTSHV